MSRGLVFPVLQKAQKFHLQRRRNIPDFIQKQRAALGKGNAARLVFFCVGERAGLIAEQLRLKQRIGQGSAVDRDYGPVFSMTQFVYGLGYQFLARAAGALDQYRAVAFSDPGSREKTWRISLLLLMMPW